MRTNLRIVSCSSPFRFVSSLLYIDVLFCAGIFEIHEGKKATCRCTQTLKAYHENITKDTHTHGNPEQSHATLPVFIRILHLISQFVRLTRRSRDAREDLDQQIDRVRVAACLSIAAQRLQLSS